jgi:hypothetical protein
MTRNTQRAIAFGLFALGLVLGLLGWMGDVYSSSTGTILFLICLFASIGLRIMWGLKK